ncbi:MAG: hypothetical protein NTW75_12410 [Planctomycetales bacterium]|nr:hypothetical protein [Planctomycetales bacterium]
MTSEPSLQFKSVREYSCDGDLLSVVRIPETNQLFAGGSHGQIMHIDLAPETPVVSSWPAHVSYVSSLVLTNDQLISAGSDHRLIWWDRESHRPLRIVDDHPKWVRALALSPDQRIVASVCDDMVCRLWETSSGKLIRELHGHSLQTSRFLPSKLYQCTFSPDGSHLATADQSGQILIWDVATGQQVTKLMAPHFFTHDTNGHGYGGIRGLAFSRDGLLIAACGNQAGDTSQIGGSKALIRVYDWATGESTHEWNVGGNFFYERVQFHPNGVWLIGVGGAGAEQKIAVFDLVSKSAVHLEASPMLNFDFAMSEKADRLFTVGRKDATANSRIKRGYLIQWELTTTAPPAG